MAQVRKFKYGVLKGKPLDSRGKYNIVLFKGERVAQFPSGALAYFTVEESDEVPVSNEPLSEAQINREKEIAALVEPTSTFMPETLPPVTPGLTHKTRKNSVRWTSQGDTFDFWLALAITFWADGFSVDLSWLNFVIEWHYESNLKRRSE